MLAPLLVPYAFIFLLIFFLILALLKNKVKFIRPYYKELILLLLSLLIIMRNSSIDRFIIESITLLSMLGFFLLFEKLRPTVENIRNLFRSFFIGSVIIFVFYAIILSTPISNLKTLPVGISGTSNYTSFYLYLGFILFSSLFVRNTFLKLFFYFLGFYSILMLNTRSIFLLSVVTIILSNFRITFKEVSIGIVTVISTFFILLYFDFFDSSDPNDPLYSIINWEKNFSNVERLYLLFVGYKSILSSPLGFGFGGSEQILSSDPLIDGKHPHFHNTIVDLMVTFGWLGLLIYIFFFIKPLLDLVKNLKFDNKFRRTGFALLMSLVLYSLIESIFFNASLLFIVIISILSLRYLRFEQTELTSFKVVKC
ncbi:MAG: O-antigen ligase family protein [Balneola sp.]